MNAGEVSLTASEMTDTMKRFDVKRFPRLFIRHCWRILIAIKDRLLLHHLLHPNAPAFDIAKAFITVVFSLLIDRATQNPDRVTSAFIAILCISPLTTTGLRAAKSIFIAAMLGTIIGSVVNVIFWVEPKDPDITWWLLFKTPIAVAITYYALFVARRYSPSELASGLLSAIVVNAVMHSYPPLKLVIHDWPRHQILSTIVTRTIALVTAIVSSTLTNILISGWSKLTYLRCRLFFVEEVVWRTFRHLHLNPTTPSIQHSFSLTLALLHDTIHAKNEILTLRRTERALGLVEERAQLLFSLLSIQSTLCALGTNPSISQEEKKGLELMLHYSSGHGPREATKKQKKQKKLTKRKRKKKLPPEEPEETEPDLTPSERFEGIIDQLPPSLLILAEHVLYLLEEIECRKITYKRLPNSLFWGLGCDFITKPDRWSTLKRQVKKDFRKRRKKRYQEVNGREHEEEEEEEEEDVEMAGDESAGTDATSVEGTDATIPATQAQSPPMRVSSEETEQQGTGKGKEKVNATVGEGEGT